MKRSSPTTLVENRIRELEMQYANHVSSVRSSLNNLGTQLRTSKLLEPGVKNITGSKSIGPTALVSALGIGAGLFAKKLLVNKSNSLLKKIAGTGLQFLLSSVFARGLHKNKNV